MQSEESVIFFLFVHALTNIYTFILTKVTLSAFTIQELLVWRTKLSVT